ncbi:MAG: hypothetical protein HY327_10740 [Chloroflexi bacterium]|nr:hypothetical protein [Chloroflexota bacterium]
MNKKVLLIIGGVALGACLLCAGIIVVAGALGVGLTQPAATVGDAFMTALKNGDYDAAYNLCAPSLQQELKSARNLETLVKNGKVQPTEWTFASRDISGDSGQLDGTVKFTGNREGTVRVVLAQVGGAWKVTGFNLKEK